MWGTFSDLVLSQDNFAIVGPKVVISSKQCVNGEWTNSRPSTVPWDCLWLVCNQQCLSGVLHHGTIPEHYVDKLRGVTDYLSNMETVQPLSVPFPAGHPSHGMRGPQRKGAFSLYIEMPEHHCHLHHSGIESKISTRMQETTNC